VNPAESKPVADLAKQDKVRFLVERNFPIVWFSSKEVQSLYEKELKEPISLSTVSTYLSRMTDRGMLLKSSASNKRRYRLVTQITQDAINLVKDNKATGSSM
jgi:predicted transcriptional regulator